MTQTIIGVIETEQPFSSRVRGRERLSIVFLAAVLFYVFADPAISTLDIMTKVTH
jgi:hypothetical protein